MAQGAATESLQNLRGVGEITQRAIGGSGKPLPLRAGGIVKHGERLHANAFGGAHADHNVFEHRALPRRHAHAVGDEHIQVRMVFVKTADLLDAKTLADDAVRRAMRQLGQIKLPTKNRSVILLADTKTAKSDYKLAVAWCAAHKASIKDGYVFGGTSAVSQTVWNALVDSTKTTSKTVKVEQEKLQPTYTTGG